MPVELRAATMADADELLTWRNDPATRAASFNEHLVPLDRHLVWLESKLVDPECRLWVGVVAGGRVGSVRVDGLTGPAPEIHVVVAPDQRGHGYATELLRGALRELAAMAVEDEVYARVKDDNEASLASFRRAGFGNEVIADGVVTLTARPGDAVAGPRPSPR
jgi:RimJ/RimL family protein N-acetyltransferase